MTKAKWQAAESSGYVLRSIETGRLVRGQEIITRLAAQDTALAEAQAKLATTIERYEGIATRVKAERADLRDDVIAHENELVSVRETLEERILELEGEKLSEVEKVSDALQEASRERDALLLQHEEAQRELGIVRDTRDTLSACAEVFLSVIKNWPVQDIVTDELWNSDTRESLSDAIGDAREQRIIEDASPSPASPECAHETVTHVDPIYGGVCASCGVFTRAYKNVRGASLASPEPDMQSDAIKIATGCLDYGGGYRGDEQRFEAFHHGIRTVVTALTAWRENPDGIQVASLRSMGEAASPASPEGGERPKPTCPECGGMARHFAMKSFTGYLCFDCDWRDPQGKDQAGGA